MANFPELPIVQPDPPRLSTAQKYGSAFYLAVAGLTILVALIGFFGYQFWGMRQIWTDVYIVNDARRPELDRIRAAWRLAHDPRVNDRQKWDIALSRMPPPLARYLLAESLSAEATAADPRGYALAAARSEGWPAWVRPLVARPLAYAAASGMPVDREALRELAQNPDPFAALWAEAALLMDDDPKAGAALRRSAEFGNAPERDFASLLLRAVASKQPTRTETLDEATRRLRSLQPDAAALWRGWEESEAGIRPVPAPELPEESP